MAYIALRDFDGFKKGDSIPEEIIEGRLIRGKKIGLANGSAEVQEKEEVIPELITEVVDVQQNEELLLEDSSSVTIEVKEEIIPEVLAPVEAKETKKTKK